MIFSEKLNLLRKDKGLTQEELAEKLCVSRQAIAKRIKWECPCSVKSARAFFGFISRFLHYPICSTMPARAEKAMNQMGWIFFSLGIRFVPANTASANTTAFQLRLA